MKTTGRKGFTLAEMLVVISIIGIGAAMTFALGSGFIQGNKISQATRMTHVALLEARSRAIATKQQTSVVFYRNDNLAVITNYRWEPIGQPLVIPEPCFFYIYNWNDYLPAGWGINKIAPSHYIMIVTFEATGAAIKNIPRAYWNGETRCGAIFVTIIDPTQAYGPRGGSVSTDDGETLTLTASKWSIPQKGYCVVGSELVSYNNVGWTANYKAQLEGCQRGLFGTGSGSLKGMQVYPAGFCGSIMVICATGHVVTVLI